MKNLSFLRYPKLYRSYLSMAIKTRLQYRVDAIFGAISFTFTNIISFSTIYLIVSVVPALEGFTFDNLMLLYAFVLVPKAIDHIFTDAVWYVGSNYVVRGMIDKYLIKPLNPLFQIIAEVFQPEGFGELLLGIVLLAIYIPKQGITWTAHNIIPLIICGFFATFIFFGVKLFTATLSFWMKRSIPVMSTFYNISDFARYPLRIFGNAFKTIMVYIVPFGLVLYMPIEYLIQGKPMWILSLIIALSASFYVFLAYQFWKWGLRHYESSGS